ncbi:IS3 family transposase [Paraburkholderia sp. CNPSo 3076]|uniref:IS3 family transposase n=1 Tax=Paraburkholderia sp. CNPSo 3076 TaxID=2940936 RepID=UPI00224F4368|nr:IS3 family transposase [Paraburkholderia sp. CNPSo 3076]MCX5545774.1 IS3 family transposase [Paraburkholderia sp. CNPSo 3076]
MKKRFTEQQIIGFLKEARAGRKVKDLCKQHVFSDASFYAWRSKFGGMAIPAARRLKALQAENARLKKLLANATLKTEALKVAIKCKALSPEAKREAVLSIRTKVDISERHACRLVGLSRSSLHYKATPDCKNKELTARLMELARERRRFGYRRLHALIEREGIHVNHKRVYRLYQQAGLRLRRRRQRRGVMDEREKLALPSGPNEIWAIDFVMDTISNGRRLKCLTIVDVFTREALDIVVDRRIVGSHVARALDCAARFRGYPRALRTDNGPEFTSLELDQWAYRNGVALKFIQPGKPTQNAYIESFNGKFRDECLNLHCFVDLSHARSIISAWRRQYNEDRPHSALNYLSPAEFATKYRAKADVPASVQEPLLAGILNITDVPFKE